MMGSALAELPSWGLTKQQYESSEVVTRLVEIGKIANKKNYKLSITAPMDWHEKIRNNLTQENKLQVQLIFKDSLYESVSLVAEKGTKLIKSNDFYILSQ